MNRVSRDPLGAAALRVEGAQASEGAMPAPPPPGEIGRELGPSEQVRELERAFRRVAPDCISGLNRNAIGMALRQLAAEIFRGGLCIVTTKAVGLDTSRLEDLLTNAAQLVDGKTLMEAAEEVRGDWSPEIALKPCPGKQG